LKAVLQFISGSKYFIVFVVWLLRGYQAIIEPILRRAWGVLSVRAVPDFPESARVHGRIKVLVPSGLSVGQYVRIGEGCIFHCGGGVTIGENTQISRRVTIYSTNHDFKGSSVPYSNEYIFKSVKIGRSVWIGTGVLIRPGVEIGDGAIIGMGCVVTRDVGPCEIVVAPPHTVLGRRDGVTFFKNLNEKRLFGYQWPDL
jgi:acetyltransferase-like isoleucine patch superfamily enzyme